VGDRGAKAAKSEAEAGPDEEGAAECGGCSDELAERSAGFTGMGEAIQERRRRPLL
jgi:hypothetical protein